MRRIAIPNTVDCPHCREKNPAAEVRCRACGKALTLYIGPAESLPRRLDLRSIMLLIAVVALCLVVMRQEVALGVFLLLLTVPALLRTFAVLSTYRSDGRPMGAVEIVATYAASVGIVWLIGVAAALAAGAVGFFVSVGWTILAELFPGGIPHPYHAGVWGLVVFAPPGALAAVAVCYYLGRALWVVKN